MVRGAASAAPISVAAAGTRCQMDGVDVKQMREAARKADISVCSI
jgi:S-adenosylhomocysteine hydrolase